MTENKKTVMKCLEGFRESNHEKILSCLTETVYWEMPGVLELTGKEAFDEEIESDCFVGSPDITILRMMEENDIVVAEGALKYEKKEGGFLDALFCDVFHLENGKINRLTTYQMNK